MQKCPTCGAEPGQKCSGKGNKNHFERMRAAQAAANPKLQSKWEAEGRPLGTGPYANKNGGSFIPSINPDEEGVSHEEIEASRTSAGGWTKEQMAAWGVSWPPKPGWRKDLVARWEARNHDQKAKSIEELHREMDRAAGAGL